MGKIIDVEIEMPTSEIICSGRKLESITKEIEDNLHDAFKEISLRRQRGRENEFYNSIEEIDGYLCKIQELVSLIK